MIANTEDDEFRQEYHTTLMRVIDKQPKLFAKWCDIKERFSLRSVWDEAQDPFYGINDALNDWNEATL